MREVMQRQMQATRRQILMTLKTRGGMTADELSQVLGITAMGVRRHLMALERDGLVAYDTVQRGVGRPSYVYHLTELADELFPKNYDRLAKELLEIIEALDGEEKVEQLFAIRMQRLVEIYKPRLAGKDLAKQVEELARIQNENGYLAEWEQLDENTFVLSQYNCTISEVAKQCPYACDYEMRLYQELLPEAEVTRIRHATNGEVGCHYQIVCSAAAK